MTKALRGVFPALITPFKEPDESIDEATLRSLVNHLIESGVHGIVPLGSTGEFFALSESERMHVLEVVIEETAGRVPVVPHTGAMSTAESIRLTKHAQMCGAAAAMALTPHYEPLSDEEVKRYYRELSDSSELPLMLYNLPSASGRSLSPELIEEILQLAPNVKYVKDTSGDFTAATRLIHRFGDRIGVFIGAECLFLAAIVEGAAGSIMGAANVVPNELVEVYTAAQSGDITRAKRAWSQVYPVIEQLGLGPTYLSSVKSAVELVGNGPRLQRSPGLDLSPQLFDSLRSVLGPRVRA